MNKLYYGNGECSIEGNASIVIIQYKGAVEIVDTTSKDYYIYANAKTISISPVRKPGNSLGKLFKYKGDFKITSVISAGSARDNAPTTIKRVMDYSELLNTNSEDMTTKSEDLRSTYQYGSRVAATKLIKKIIPDLHTDDKGSPKLLLDGEEYTGSYHSHIISGMIMTGAGHTSESKELKRRK